LRAQGSLRRRMPRAAELRVVRGVHNIASQLTNRVNFHRRDSWRGMFPSLAPGPGRLSCPREPSGPFHSSPILRRCFRHDHSVILGRRRPDFPLTTMPSPKSRGFPVQLNLKPHIRDASINRHAVVQPSVSMQDPTMIEAGARAFASRGCASCHDGPESRGRNSPGVCALTLQISRMRSKTSRPRRSFRSSAMAPT
jgi:hypothetical protein